MDCNNLHTRVANGKAVEYTISQCPIIHPSWQWAQGLSLKYGGQCKTHLELNQLYGRLPTIPKVLHLEPRDVASVAYTKGGRNADAHGQELGPGQPIALRKEPPTYYVNSSFTQYICPIHLGSGTAPGVQCLSRTIIENTHQNRHPHPPHPIFLHPNLPRINYSNHLKSVPSTTNPLH